MEQLIRVGGLTFDREKSASGVYQDALRAARSSGVRAHCLCSQSGVGMYIGLRSGTLYIAKMPGTGRQHHTSCPSFDVDGDLAGEAMDGDRIALSADFPLTRRAWPTSISLAENISVDATLPPRKLPSVPTKKTSLEGLLRLLWSQAELNRWVPRMAGKRGWGLIRHLTCREASTISLSGIPLETRLFLPEVFRADQQEEHRERNLGELDRLLPIPDARSHREHYAIVIGIAKNYRPSKFGCKLQLKHLPETVFYIDGRLARCLTEKQTFELLAIGREQLDHVLTAMLVERTEKGHFIVADMALIRMTKEWLPVYNAHEAELINYLVGYSRSFVRVADTRAVNAPAPVVYLTDTGDSATPLFIDTQHGTPLLSDKWRWCPSLSRVSSIPLPEIA